MCLEMQDAALRAKAASYSEHAEPDRACLQADLKCRWACCLQHEVVKDRLRFYEALLVLLRHLLKLLGR